MDKNHSFINNPNDVSATDWRLTRTTTKQPPRSLPAREHSSAQPQRIPCQCQKHITPAGLHNRGQVPFVSPDGNFGPTTTNSFSQLHNRPIQTTIDLTIPTTTIQEPVTIQWCLSTTTLTSTQRVSIWYSVLGTVYDSLTAKEQLLLQISLMCDYWQILLMAVDLLGLL